MASYTVCRRGSKDFIGLYCLGFFPLVMRIDFCMRRVGLRDLFSKCWERLDAGGPRETEREFLEGEYSFTLRFVETSFIRFSIEAVAIR